jgi:hypothetical protein
MRTNDSVSRFVSPPSSVSKFGPSPYLYGYPRRRHFRAIGVGLFTLVMLVAFRDGGNVAATN